MPAESPHSKAPLLHSLEPQQLLLLLKLQAPLTEAPGRVAAIGSKSRASEPCCRVLRALVDHVAWPGPILHLFHVLNHTVPSTSLHGSLWEKGAKADVFPQGKRPCGQ